MLLAGLGAFLHLLRFSIDLVSKVSAHLSELEKKEATDKKKDGEEKDDNDVGASRRWSGKSGRLGSFLRQSSTRKSYNMGIKNSQRFSNLFRRNSSNYKQNNSSLQNTVQTEKGASDHVLNELEEQFQEEAVENSSEEMPGVLRWLPTVSILLQIVFLCYFAVATTLVSTVDASSTKKHQKEWSNAAYRGVPLGAATIGILFSTLTSIIDKRRIRFGTFQRFFYLMGSLMFLFNCCLALFRDKEIKPTAVDYATLAIFFLYFCLAVCEVKLYPSLYDRVDLNNDKDEGEEKKAHLNRRAILLILKPYFWPSKTATTATVNRVRAIMTWVFVASGKACSLTAPIYLGRASTALSRFDYANCTRHAIIYCVLSFLSKFFSECQSLIYLKVAQAAFVELSEISFSHLHSLSLDWHLRKKLGEVLRSMDRGIMACDLLMKYAFLWLFPAIAECILVCIIFLAYFDYLPLAATIFIFVFVYIFWTILITLFRKRIRSKVTKQDNDFHDKCTDSLVNFETVKYFTAEQYEKERFGDAVKKYQSGSVQVQASLSFMNITQQLLMQSCLAVSLTLAAYGIKKRIDCCVSAGCSVGNSQCCSDMSGVCSGMEIGDFVTVLTYTLNLFMPLNFLGTVYNMIVMAVIDLRHLSELLAESPDVTDAPDAMELPKVNGAEPDVAVEFDNVRFHYPSQPDTKGLKGLSFKMKRGTTTAIVGTTGAGKTTVSRLFFRFYDVLGGAIKVNGVDVRSLSQKSLRSSIGVVPQATSMFNDTLRYNILYGNQDATDEELNNALKDAQLKTFIDSLPEGWETLVGDRGLKLSGGEKQRTAIARCLIKDPPFVILDEATSALDTVTENSVQEALDRLGNNRTCLVIAHRLGTICRADNIVVIDDGVVIEQGTHDDLLSKKDGKYAEMWNMQLHSNKNSSTSLSTMAEVKE
jgi:ABC-type transport system involved in Fe-S cluster assembly fused permease/ATPase subunit